MSDETGWFNSVGALAKQKEKKKKKLAYTFTWLVSWAIVWAKVQSRQNYSYLNWQSKRV